jgi:GNAT superfamily N-acetyltransferase
MSNFTFRSVTFEDIDVVHQLIAEQNILDFGEPLRTTEDILRGWRASNFNLELDAVFAIAPNDQIIGYAELQDKEDVFVYLASQYQDANLAGQLLGLLEDRARSQMTEAKSVDLWGRASSRNPVLTKSFETSGYKSNISFLIMKIVLTEKPQAPTWPDGIVARTFIANQDEQATYQTDEEASIDKGYHDPLSYEQWMKRMGMNRDTFDPGVWFIALEKDEFAGVALNVIDKNANIGWVDHLSVRRAWRNKGIGKALLLHTFGEFFKRGVHTIKLSVDSKSLTNAPHLYESVGMKTVEQYHVYKKTL